MEQLLILNFVLIAVIAIGLLCVKKYCKSERIKDILLIASSIFTVFCHYSSLLYHHFTDGQAMEYLSHNPNLLLPIYPCNVVMWSCVVYALLKNKNSRVGRFLCDYIFWFGIVSVSLVKKDSVDEFINNVGEFYRSRIGYDASFYVAEIADGMIG